jgi:spermidine synthase
MALPWKNIAAVDTPEGTLELRQRGEGDYLILLDGSVLMNSRAHRSEMLLGRLACRELQLCRKPQVLIGGLGMGFTLRAVLDNLPEAGRVVVAELNKVVLDWCQGPLAALTQGAVTDARVRVEIMDVAQAISQYAGQGAQGRLDAIVLDLFSGPYAHAHKNDDPLFGMAAMHMARAALKSGGIYAVWGENYDPGFHNRLKSMDFVVNVQRAKTGGPRHVVYLAQRPKRKRRI